MRRPSSGGVGATDPAAAQSRSTVDGVPAASAGGRRNWWAFFVLGTINNLGYVVVLSGAKSISRYFHALKWIGLLNWADVGLSFVARGAATSLAGRPGWPFQLRININSALMLIGLIGTALSKYVGFWFALLSITFIGASSTFGESVLLGYLKAYPTSLTGAWSSGTGMAGVLGSAFYLGLNAAGVSDEAVFWLTVPTVALYIAAFTWGVKKPVDADDTLAPRPFVPAHPAPGHASVQAHAGDDGGDAISHEAISFRVVRDAARENNASDPTLGDGERNNSAGQLEEQLLLGGDGMRPQESAIARGWRVTRLISYYGVNLMLVYVLEYVISVGLAAQAEASTVPADASVFVRKSYAILAFCYQFGVLISRSSLSCYRVKRIHFLTILQAVNFAFWIVQDKTLFLGGNQLVWVQFVWMVWVGLMGGAGYVQTFALLREDASIPKDDRELAVNIVAIFISVGIVAASVFDIVMDHTFLIPKT